MGEEVAAVALVTLHVGGGPISTLPSAVGDSPRAAAEAAAFVAVLAACWVRAATSGVDGPLLALSSCWTCHSAVACSTAMALAISLTSTTPPPCPSNPPPPASASSFARFCAERTCACASWSHMG